MRPLRTLHRGCAQCCRSGVRRLICPAAFAAWNRDDAVRKDSTSGGAFTAIADYVLEGGGVVFGAALGRPAASAAHRLLPQGGPVAAAGSQVRPERSGRRVPGDPKEAAEDPPGAVLRHTLSGGWAVPLSGRAGRKISLPAIWCATGYPSPGVWEDEARSIEGQ